MSEYRDPQAPVVVIGAGIVGTCIAISLLSEGRRVTIVDREGPAAGASSGNAGAISPGSCIPLATPGILKHVPKWLLDRDGPLVLRYDYLLQAMPWLVRFLAAIVSAACLGFGYLWILVDRDGRAWHDRWSGTRVVYYPPPPRAARRHRGSRV